MRYIIVVKNSTGAIVGEFTSNKISVNDAILELLTKAHIEAGDTIEVTKE